MKICAPYQRPGKSRPYEQVIEILRRTGRKRRRKRRVHVPDDVDCGAVGDGVGSHTGVKLLGDGGGRGVCGRVSGHVAVLNGAQTDVSQAVGAHHHLSHAHTVNDVRQ